MVRLQKLKRHIFESVRWFGKTSSYIRLHRLGQPNQAPGNHGPANNTWIYVKVLDRDLNIYQGWGNFGSSIGRVEEQGENYKDQLPGWYLQLLAWWLYPRALDLGAWKLKLDQKALSVDMSDKFIYPASISRPVNGWIELQDAAEPQLWYGDHA